MSDLAEVPPNPSNVLNDLKYLTPELWQAFEAGTEHGRDFFELFEKPVEVYQFSSTVRWSVRHSLADAGLQLADLPNNGLNVQFKEYSIRMIKSDNGELPPPGPSQTKQAFYQQRLPLVIQDAIVRVAHHNVLVAWSVDRNYVLTDLTLYYPRYGDENTSDCHWSISLPHPEETSSVSDVNSIVWPDFDTDDLEISSIDDRSGRSDERTN